MPDGSFEDVGRLPSWSQYSLSARSLLQALKVDDPEETLFIQATISEVSMLAFGLLLLARVFPEFLPIASNLSDKIAQVSGEQQFLRRDTLDSE